MQIQPCTLISGDLVTKTMQSELLSGKYQAEPFKSEAKAHGVPVDILVDNNVARDQATVEVHRHEADLWVMIDGEVTFEVGGKIEGAWIKKRADGTYNDLELKGQGITDGTIHHLKPGDILFIPAGQPHVHWNEAGKTGRLWIVKVPTREIVPFDAIPGVSGTPPIV